MNGISFERPFKFSYKNGDNVRTYKFIYDTRKEIYHEKIETLYFIDNHYIKVESYHTTYFRDFRDIEVFNLYGLLRNREISIFIESINKLLKAINKPIAEVNISMMLQSMAKTELLILEVLKNMTPKKELYFYIDNKIYMLQNSVKESLQHFYTFLKSDSYSSKEVVISKDMYLINEKLIQSISKIVLCDLLEESKNKEIYNENLIINMKKDINLCNINNNVLMVKQIAYIYINKDITKSDTDIFSDILSDLELIIEPIQLLTLVNHLISKFTLDICSKKIDFKGETFIEEYNKRFVNNAKNVSYINKMETFIKDFYDYINMLSENKADKISLKDVFKDDLDIKTDKSVIRDILSEILFNFLIKDVTKDIFIEDEYLYFIKDRIKDIFTEKEYLCFLKDISNKIFFDLNDKQFIKDETMEIHIEDVEKLLYKDLTDNELQVLIEKISSFTSKKDKAIDYIAENILVKYKDLLISLANTRELFKDKLQTNIVKNILLNADDRNISYLEDTLLFSEQKILNIEDERQLTLWKRFWFLYAGKEIDIKILPYYDFPYEINPIYFENTEDLYPENWNVTHPHEFWKKIDYHPVEHGTGEGLKEIKLAINIMIDIINILILMWAKHYSHFWGWTGTQAVLGLAENVYEWLRLETSLTIQEEKGVKSHYDRCFRWLRWEVEKVSLMARNDMELRGNYWVGILIEELINYMLDHHFDTMPLFEDVNKMDEWRRSFNRDLQKDIEYVIEKVKGIRHKLIDGKERKING